MSEATGQKRTDNQYTDKDYKFEYDGRDSDGNPTFKHYTEQSLEYVTGYLDSMNIEYEPVKSARMLWIHYADRSYYYYYTTGRWARYYSGSRPKKHYRSKGIVDFINRFVLEKDDE